MGFINIERQAAAECVNAHKEQILLLNSANKESSANRGQIESCSRKGASRYGYAGPLMPIVSINSSLVLLAYVHT